MRFQNNDNENGNINPRSMSKKELAQHYNITVATLNVWFEKAGLQIPKFTKILTPLQVKSIFEKIGD